MFIRHALLAGLAFFAVSGAASAQNVVTTTQIGLVNGSSTTQNGATNNTASLGQLGLVNVGVASQGTSSPGVVNTSTMTQFGVANSATTSQVGVLNGSGITQNSFGIGSNSASVGQLGLGNISVVNQTH